MSRVLRVSCLMVTLTSGLRLFRPPAIQFSMVCLIVSSAASSVFSFLFAIQSVCYSVFYASLRTLNLRCPGPLFGVSLSGSFPAFGGTLHSVIDSGLIFGIAFSVSTLRLVVFGREPSPRLMMRRIRSRRASKAVTWAETCVQRSQRCSGCPRVDDPSSSDPETRTKYIGQAGWCGAWERKTT